MKRLIAFILCIFFSFTMLFALDSSTTGNVSLNVAIDSVAIGFVDSEEKAKSATSSTSKTNHVVLLTPKGTEYSYNGEVTLWFYWKIMTGETNLKVSLSADGPLILNGKNISNAEENTRARSSPSSLRHSPSSSWSYPSCCNSAARQSSRPQWSGNRRTCRSSH